MCVSPRRALTRSAATAFASSAQYTQRPRAYDSTERLGPARHTGPLAGTHVRKMTLDRVRGSSKKNALLEESVLTGTLEQMYKTRMKRYIATTLAVTLSMLAVPHAAIANAVSTDQHVRHNHGPNAMTGTLTYSGSTTLSNGWTQTYEVYADSA